MIRSKKLNRKVATYPCRNHATMSNHRLSALHKLNMRCTATTLKGTRCKRKAREYGGECEQHAGLMLWREQQAVLERYKADPPIVGQVRLVRLRRNAEGAWGFMLGSHKVSCEGYSLCIMKPGQCWDRGLRHDQRILNANGVDLKDVTFDDAVSLIRNTTEDTLALVVVEPADGHGYRTPTDVAREQWAEDARLAAERRAARRVEMQEAARRVVSGVRREALEKARREALEKARRERKEREAADRERYEETKRDQEQQEEWIREAEERARERRRGQCWGWLKWGRNKRSASAARPATGVLEPLLAMVENPLFAQEREHDHQD